MKTKLLSVFTVTALSTAIAIVACKKKEEVDQTPYIVSFGKNPNILSTVEQANSKGTIEVNPCSDEELFDLNQVQVNPSSAEKKLVVETEEGEIIRAFGIIGKDEEKSRLYLIKCIKNNK